ncbi:hypothetical protein FRC17_008976 [Serendipita sp. 399]|nr:hypothetical protein FRC17_008976 [Serendipita sp. 399]
MDETPGAFIVTEGDFVPSAVEKGRAVPVFSTSFFFLLRRFLCFVDVFPCPARIFGCLVEAGDESDAVEEDEEDDDVELEELEEDEEDDDEEEEEEEDDDDDEEEEEEEEEKGEEAFELQSGALGQS